MFFLEDKDGNLLLEQLTTPKCRILSEYTEKLSGKKYPKEVEYTLTHGKRKLVYTIRQEYELESREGGHLTASQQAEAQEFALAAANE